MDFYKRKHILNLLNFSVRHLTRRLHSRHQPDFDLNYLCNPLNAEEIGVNISNRKGVGDIRLINDIKQRLDATDPSSGDYQRIEQHLLNELIKLPNKTHPCASSLGDEPRIIKQVGSKGEYDAKPLEFYEIGKRLKLMRTDQLGNVCGSRSYFLLGQLAELEQALIRYTTAQLIKNQFKLVSVPDILDRSVIEACGQNTRGDRTQVYVLDGEKHGSDLCLSGTSEMALAANLANKILDERDLPLKLASISRCYRAETSSIAEERGIYRVHEFTKVEMFMVATPETSDQLIEAMCQLQQDLFAPLGLHFLVLDMPAHELGAPAYRKYDIEAWMPGRQMYGEISSCSNCTDYQSRRLGIRCTWDGSVRHAHTLNGTACAIPRMLIAICETHQRSNGKIAIPTVLRKYMDGREFIVKQRIPELLLAKNKK